MRVRARPLSGSSTASWSVAAGLILAFVALIVATGASASSSAPATSVQRRAQTLCLAAVPTVARLDADEQRAVADWLAGKLSGRALGVRIRTEVLTLSMVDNRLAAEIAAIPGEQSDAVTKRLVVGMQRLANVGHAYELAIGRNDGTAVNADAKQADALGYANNRLVPGCGLGSNSDTIKAQRTITAVRTDTALRRVFALETTFNRLVTAVWKDLIAGSRIKSAADFVRLDAGRIERMGRINSQLQQADASLPDQTLASLDNPIAKAITRESSDFALILNTIRMHDRRRAAVVYARLQSDEQQHQDTARAQMPKILAYIRKNGL
jgi:hypothetical protein